MATTSFNQTDVDAEGTTTLFVLAEGLVFLLSLLRILVVSIVLAVNVIALRRCGRPAPSTAPKPESGVAVSTALPKCHCLHLYVSDSVKICSIIYITSWVPFLFYSLFNGRWLWIDEQIFCLVQNYITNAILLVLLAMAALTAWNRTSCWRGAKPMAAAALTLAAWILPQLANFLILTTSQIGQAAPNGPLQQETAGHMNFDFLDDLLGTGQTSAGTSGINYKIGFTICGQGLCRLAVTQYLLQYVIIIVPISLVCAALVVRHVVRQCRPYADTLNDHKINLLTVGADKAGCDCSSGADSPALEIILGATVVWLAAVRPAVLVLWSRDHLFVDLGSHLMLTVAAVFAPILPNTIVPSRQVKIFQIHPADDDAKHCP